MCVDGVHYPKLSWEYSSHGDFVCPDGVGLEDADVFGGCWLAHTDLETELEDDGDTIVSLPELARLGEYWRAAGCGDCGGIDITGDGQVTIDDLTAVAADWLLAEAPECGRADMNGDAVVNLKDWAEFTAHWLGAW